MKKLVAILAAAVLAGGSIFAGDFYNGDIQIQLGVGNDTIKVQDENESVKGTLVDFGLETWHLFRPIELVGVGFSMGFNGGLGPCDKMSNGTENGLSANINFNIGPAAAIYLGKVVRFGVNFGLNTGFSFDQPYIYQNSVTVRNTTYSTRASSELYSTYVGIDFGLQAKFLPESVVNPVIGWRLSTGSNSQYNVHSTSYSSLTSSTNTERLIAGRYEFTQSLFYLALSFSW